MSIRRERDSRLVAKSVRTHEKTMQALGQAAGGWKRTADDPNIGPKVKDRASIAYTDTPARKNDSFFEPGSTNKGKI